MIGARAINDKGNAFNVLRMLRIEFRAATIAAGLLTPPGRFFMMSERRGWDINRHNKWDPHTDAEWAGWLAREIVDAAHPGVLMSDHYVPDTEET